MEKYINPPESVKDQGREIYGQTWDSLKAKLRPKEHLYGLFDKGIHKLAVHLDSASEFKEFYGQYLAGWMLSVDFYAVPEKG